MNQTTKTTDFLQHLSQNSRTPLSPLHASISTPVVPILSDTPELSPDSLDTQIVHVIEAAFDDATGESPDALAQALATLCDTQVAIFESLDLPLDVRSRSFLCANGVCLSPEHCTSTLKDTLRVRAFLRGAHQALATLSTPEDGIPLHIVYPACGPFAPLLLPLIAHYRARGTYTHEQLQITLIDLQEGAIASLHAIIDAYDIAPYIKAVLQIDACDYQPDEGEHIDMVVLESFQHGFTREGHMAIARHFAPLLAKGGVFLPQNVSIRAFLTNPTREYVDQWKDRTDVREHTIDPKIKEERTDIGEILSLTPQNVQNLKTVPSNHPGVTLLECGTLRIPEPPTERDRQMMLFAADLTVYGDERIGQYDSGITHPFPDFRICVNFKPGDSKDDDILLESGDLVTFFYRMDGLPAFLPHKRMEQAR